MEKGHSIEKMVDFDEFKLLEFMGLSGDWRQLKTKRERAMQAEENENKKEREKKRSLEMQSITMINEET